MLKNSPSIGTKRESSLHSSLKFQYSGTDGETEALSGSYICDGRTAGGELIEVQTGSFGPLRDKVKSLCKTEKVRIIHPIITKKFIELYNNGGEFVHRRKSPRKGSNWDLFNALLYAPEIPLIKNLYIELAIIDLIEKRIDDGKGSWRRKGVSISDRFLAAWHESVILKSPRDYYQFIPFKKKERFTVKCLGEKAGISTVLARKTLYVLEKIGIAERVERKGRAYIYMLK